MGGNNSRMEEIKRDLPASVQRITEVLEIDHARRDEDKEPSDEELEKAILHFLEEFPRERKKIEGWLRCLQEKADVIDKNYKDSKIAKLSSSSGGAVSGVLSIAGLALAPVTAGMSLILTLSSLGIGIAAGVTGISAGVCENHIHSKEMKTTEELIKNCEGSLRKVLSLEKIGCSSGIRSESSPVSKTSQDCTVNLNLAGLIQNVKQIGEHVDALKNVTASPGLAKLAKKATTLGEAARSTVKGIDQVDEVFKGTALAMSKGARMAGIAFSGIFLAVDVGFIILDSVKLAMGAKTKEAAKIRYKVNVFEKVIQLLSRLHEELEDIWECHGSKPDLSTLPLSS